MKDIHLHSVVVNYDSFEILSADTDFYAYMGSERFFTSFEKLIHRDSLDYFLDIVKKKDTKPFVINMIRENKETVIAYMCISYEGDKMSIELQSVEGLKNGQEHYRTLSALNQELLGLHNDVIFTYDDEAEMVRLYTPDFKRCVHAYTLKEFTDIIKSNIKDSDTEKLDNLLVSLKAENGSFVYNFEGSILPEIEECKTSIVKGFCVEDYDEITAVGYIHRASNKAAATYTVEKDALTGTYSKREIANMARKTIEVDHQLNVAICIIDIDYFKSVNDNFGHMMGDEVLKDVAGIIKKEVGNSGVVGRFGGDEFFVMFYDVDNMENYREKLRSIKDIVFTKYPPSDDNRTVSVTLSIGCAVYPKDADNYDDLFSLADYCLYMAKDKGRNRYVIYDAGRHGTLAEIKDYFSNNRRIDTRKDIAMGDVLCMIADQHYDDADYTPEMLVDDLVENLPIDRIVCLTGKPFRYRCMSGINLESPEIINECASLLSEYDFHGRVNKDVLVIDDLEKIRNVSEQLYTAYSRLNIKSMILVRFVDAAGKASLLSLEMTSKKIAWNQNQLYNYRTIARMLARYEL